MAYGGMQCISRGVGWKNTSMTKTINSDNKP